MQTNNKVFGFSKKFWISIVMEFFERGAYYSMMSVLSVYLVLEISTGGLGFSKEQVGGILGTIPPLLYFLPIVAGAIADRYGYRKVLFFAFICMILGYFFIGIFTSYLLVFISLLIMALGAGFFKPVISGTIAKTTTPANSGFGFGIYYWSINLGSFLFPLILVPILKSYGYHYIFFMAAGVGCLLFLINLFFYEEPIQNTSTKSLLQVFREMLLVLKDWKFLLLIILYSGFWILYFQVYGTVLWYLNEHLNMAPVNHVVNTVLGLFVQNPSWKFNVEYVTVLNAGVVICLQIVVSKLLQKAPALPTMIAGIGYGTLGLTLLAISSEAWVFIAGMVIFTLGEIITHPKFISYIGLIAPSDKKALYMGYSFLYGVIGSSVGGFLGSHLYVKYVETLHQPNTMWFIFTGIGLFSMASLALYNKFIKR